MAILGRLFMLIGVASLFGTAAAVITLRLPTTYEANTTLLIGRSTTGSDPEYQDLLASQLLAQTYAELASTRPILSAVAEELSLQQTPRQLADSMSVEASGINPIVHITVRGPDAERVAAIANEVARQLLEWKPNLDSDGRGLFPAGSTEFQTLPELRQTLAAIDTQIARAQAEADRYQKQGPRAVRGALQTSLSRLAALLSTRATLLQLIANTSSNSVLVIEPADRPTEAAGPNLVLNVAAAALLGALLAAAGMYALSEIRGSSRRPSAGG